MKKFVLLFLLGSVIALDEGEDLVSTLSEFNPFECPTGNVLSLNEVLYDGQGICRKGKRKNKKKGGTKLELGLDGDKLVLYEKDLKKDKETKLKQWDLGDQGDLLLVNEFGDLNVINYDSGVIFERGCDKDKEPRRARLILTPDGPVLKVGKKITWWYSIADDIEEEDCD